MTAPRFTSDEDWIEQSFPLGDGIADTSALLCCPYCAAEFEIALDPGGGAVQYYIEDCEVCCRPMQLTVSWNETGIANVEARSEEDR